MASSPIHFCSLLMLANSMIGAAIFYQKKGKANDVVVDEEQRWRQPPSLEVHDDSQFQIRDFVPPEDHVDVVITWNCESIDWIRGISPEFAPFLKVILLHKLDQGQDRGNPKCRAHVPSTPLDVSVVRLRNRGRDIHSPFIFIKNNYRTLAGYTMFLQADQHHILQGFPPVLTPGGHIRTFQGNAEAVNDFVRMARRKRANFIPLMPYDQRDETPVLVADRQSNIDTNAQDIIINRTSNKFKMHLSMFGNNAADCYNTARELYSILFGGTPCDAPTASPLVGISFAPGFQFIVSRHNIQRHPVRTWASLADLTLGCGAIGYAMERLSLQIFDSDKTIRDPDTWKKPSFCTLDQRPNNVVHPEFNAPWDVYRSSTFWRREWGCEPLSDFVLNWSQAP